MRESNFAFPAQNKACVCINTQLYDRRALDTTSNLPLLNSLQHLRQLTATSPRIREIMTMDGGLERLVRILYDFCLSPPPPDNPALVYGLSPSGYRPSKPTPALNPVLYDKHAAFRFSQAFECVVNIGVRGSEPIRSRVVQAGTLDVVGCVLEAWLASKGFAIGPSSSATGIPRETREQRQARRLAQAEQRQREEAAALARALQRQIVIDQMQQGMTQVQQERVRQQRIFGENPNANETMNDIPTRTGMRRTMLITDGRPHPITTATNDNDESAPDSSTVTATPAAFRDRSGTIVAHHQPNHINPRGFLNRPQPQASTFTLITEHMHYRRNTPSPSASTDTSRAETETEDEPEPEHDADGDIDMDRQLSSPSSESSRPPRPAHRTGTLASRRQVLQETRLHINANIVIPRPQRVPRGQRSQDGSHNTLHHPQPQNLYPPHYMQGHGHGQLLSPGSAVSTPASGSASPSPERGGGQGGIMRHHHHHLPGVGTGGRQVRFGTVAVADRTATITMPVGMSVGPDTDPHIVISDPGGGPGVVGDNINMAMGVGMGGIPVGMGVGGVGMGGGVVEEDMVSLQANDDFAMGAPPGAPGAIVIDTTSVGLDESGTEMGTPPPPARTYLDEGRTPRAGFTDLPDVGQAFTSTGVHQRHYHHQRESTTRARSASVGEGSSTLAASGAGTSSASTSRPVSVSRDDSEPVASGSGTRIALDEQTTSRRQNRAALSATELVATISDTPTIVNNGTENTASTTVPVPISATATVTAGTTNAATTLGSTSNSPPLSTQTSGPYRDEDVLLGLQLLAYLSKYPHVRQAFYKPRPSFHPASLGLHQASAARAAGLEPGLAARDAKERERQPPTNNQGFFRALAGRGRAALNSAGLGSSFTSSTASVTGSANLDAGSVGGAAASAAAVAAAVPTPQPKQTNVFSLVERFTFKPSSNEADLPNPPPRLPPEIQYWAGVIMRNACRKDDSRGGIRQCANMLCGRWEQYPREFAKCRRCRKAKYCGKECQSTAWSEGHRFWCSARDGDDDGADRDRRGDQDHRTEDPSNPPQGPSMGQQMQGVLDEGITNTTGTMPGGLNVPSAMPVSPRAERAARRERDRRMRELASGAGSVEPAFIPPGFHGRLNLTAGQGTMFAPPGVPSPIGETHRAPSPVAGPSNAAAHGAVLTEAATHQQRIHDQRIMESDWFSQPQAGPSRLGWQIEGPAEIRTEMEEEMTAAMIMAADGTDMVLG